MIPVHRSPMKREGGTRGVVCVRAYVCKCTRVFIQRSFAFDCFASYASFGDYATRTLGYDKGQRRSDSRYSSVISGGYCNPHLLLIDS